MSNMEYLLKFLFGLCFLHFVYATDMSGCPTNVRESQYFVETFENHCYMFVDVEKYWDDAREYCSKMGGEMLYVYDNKTMKFIKNVLNSKELGWNSYGVWNGASNLRGTGWEWTNGKRLTYGYWAEGKPTKYPGFISVKNCCCMRRADEWRWHNYHCHWMNLVYNFICQFHRSNETFTDSPTSDGAHTVDGGNDDHVFTNETFTDSPTNDGAHIVDGDSDDHSALIGLMIASGALLIVFCTA